MDYKLSITTKDKFGVKNNIKLEPRPHNVTKGIRVQKTLIIAEVTLNMNLQIDRPSPSSLNGSLFFTNAADGTSTVIKLPEKKLSVFSDTLVEYPDLQLPSGLGIISVYVTTII